MRQAYVTMIEDLDLSHIQDENVRPNIKGKF